MTSVHDIQKLADQYDRDGYAILRNVFSRKDIDSFLHEALQICSGARGELVGADIISEGANSPEDLMKNVLSIHFPHKVSELLRSTLTNKRIVDFLNAVIGPDVKCMQSMLFIKNAGKPGQAWHQDEFFIPTRDMSLAGVWIALDDARIDNGCLWVHPGSHKHRILWPMKVHGDPRFDASQEAYDFPYEREEGIPVEINAGGHRDLSRLPAAPLPQECPYDRVSKSIGQSRHECAFASALGHPRTATHD